MAASSRFEALDATRGLAILGMVLSGIVPYRSLPAWMYHAQLPPPDRVFNPNLPGITWVDLVFPMFLFCLGVAIPIAGRRFEETRHYLKHLFSRTLLLLVFAIVLHHIRPHQLASSPDTLQWILALVGFCGLFLVFIRLPSAYSFWRKMVLRAVGWSVLLMIIFTQPFKDAQGASLDRFDIILVVLANVYFAAGLLWWLTRSRPWIILTVLPVLLMFRVFHEDVCWMKAIWDFTPVRGLYQFYYLQYLFVVLPAVWLAPHLQLSQKLSTGSKALYLPGLVGLPVVLLVGLFTRELILTYWLSGMLGASLLILMICRPYQQTSIGTLLVLLFLGLLAEPLEGGIKKDPSTLSFYLIGAGCSLSVLLAFTLASSHLGRFGRLLKANGQNPMIAYVAFANVIWPVLALTGLEQFINSLTDGPWTGFIRSLSYTFLLAYLIQLLSNRKIFWKT
ncbi:DUF5009 domain-containing protein [Marinoscillum furvescens]|uniref:Uncharacterized protein DUF5009 n=1 Tax=Marinoscillum furvescens DSM 4134 TaxID=1122208 RepID=A0A3D9KYF1_MARFU|nr:DUF5009 domain-containing protein [Marinoscillum furvescens]RED93599.1 uncharacterized protein DUF5009 [Marinoscillum furvescens DSM 4134]